MIKVTDGGYGVPYHKTLACALRTISRVCKSLATLISYPSHGYVRLTKPLSHDCYHQLHRSHATSAISNHVCNKHNGLAKECGGVCRAFGRQWGR